MPQHRIYWIDYSKTLAIVMMVWAHISTFLHDEIFLFHMPLFFVVSGFLYHKRETREEAMSILFALILPYLFYNSLYVFFEGVSTLDSKYILNILLGNQEKMCSLARPLWFIVALFTMRLLCMTHCRIEILGGATLLFSIILGDGRSQENDFLQLRTSILCFPFFSIGWIWHKYFDKEIAVNKIIRVSMFLTTFLVAGVLGNLNSASSDGCINVFRCRIGGSIILFYISAVLMSVSFMMLCKELLNRSNYVIQRLSNGTLLILGLHLIVFYRIPYFKVPGIVQSFICLLIILFVSYWLISFSERYCPVLIGKRKRK